MVGFSYETIQYLLGGSIRGSYYTLNDNIINGRVRGVAGVVGCNNCRTMHDNSHLTMIKELLKNDVIVLTTGCSAMAAGKFGLLTPEAAKSTAVPGLAEVCETVGIPPVLHMGSCVDNSRILMAATACVKAGGLGTDISDLPAAGAAPEWMSEKAISIGHYFVASGVYTLFGVTFPSTGSELLTDYLFKGHRRRAGRQVGLRARPGIGGQEDDRPHRPEAESAGHRQGPGAGPHGYGHAPHHGRRRRPAKSIKEKYLGEGWSNVNEKSRRFCLRLFFGLNLFTSAAPLSSVAAICSGAAGSWRPGWLQSWPESGRSPAWRRRCKRKRRRRGRLCC